MRYLSLLLLIEFLALVPGAALGQQGRKYPPEFSDARAEIYKRVGDVELKLWVFDPPSHAPDNPRPAIIFFFGGGWKSGTPAQFEHHCRYLAQHGMVAMVADYRVRDRHQTLADRAVADAKSAVRWVRKNAGRLGVDPQRIVAGGGSAGGHLAACIATIQTLDEPDEPAEISSAANALALFNPAVVLAPFDGIPINQEKRSDLASRTGVPPEQISPIHHVRAGLPPTIIFHGEADSTVGFDTVRRYTDVNEKLGNRCELVGYPGAGHGFFNYGRGGDPGEHYLDTLTRLHNFLHSLGYIDHSAKDLSPDSANVHLRSLFQFSHNAIAERKEATVAFIGGSITEMNGYRVMMEQWLTEKFPDCNFHFVNAGISSTCSTTGACRLSRDVLSHSPDLMLVEFAVNDDQDAAHSLEVCIRGMEGIIRHTLRDSPQTDIVVTYFVNPPMLDLLQNDETPISIDAHETVVSHYGVSSVNLAKEVADRISSGRLTWKEYGGTHPAPAGNAIAAEMVQDLLTTAWNVASIEPPVDDQIVANRLPKKIDAKSYDGGRFIDLAEASCDDDWQLGRPDWSAIPGTLRQRFAENDLLTATKVGAELTLGFEGTAIGLYVLAGPDAGTVDYTIDGKRSGTVELYHRFSEGLHYPRTVMLDDNLPPGPHEIELRIGVKGDREAGGTAVRILSFAAN